MEDTKLVELEQDLNRLRTSLSPLMGFMQEIRDLKRELRISNESSTTTVEILSLAIKSDVLKDVSSLMIITDDKIRSAAEATSDRFRKHIEKIEECNRQDSILEASIKNAEELVARIANIQDIFRKELEFIKKDVGEKIHFVEFNKLKKSLKNYALNQDLQDVQKNIETLVTKSEMAKLEKETQKIAETLPMFLTKTESYEAFQKINSDMMESFSETFLKNDAFNYEMDEIRRKNVKYDDDFKILFKKFEMFQDGIRRKLTEIFDILNAKPWEPSLKPIIHQLEETVKKTEMVKIKEEIMEKIARLSLTTTDLNVKTQMFDGIIERYDEILLEKSSKDDYSLLLKQLEKCALSSSLQEISTESTRKINTLTSQFIDLSNINDSLKTLLYSVNQKVETMRKENFEVSNIATTLTGINEILERKADKSDIFIIYDVMGRKEDMQKVADIEDMSRKQILYTVGILQTFCRTFLMPGENPAVIKKQRLDVFKTLDSLQKWIKEGNGEPSMFLSIGRSGTTLKCDTLEDMHLSHYGTARVTKRYRNGSIGTSPRYFKDELPSLNL
ncbi:hypothetical protein SteCoe_12833 [Stentor coeruleus]|uniref:Uncharacterized protein n=1 Tax=Stentor coeruleus TaxID=5963 RepID=A0A1R2C9T8_9CILI|nr:hypothetical protein SteCoe_12833 [Stentor coeruleus]